MTSLRNCLAQESPELFAALNRSWEIAQKEWLPAVRPSEGSYNSLPHFTNIECHLNALLGDGADSPANRLRLTPLEHYLLLAAVLFHDYGRVFGDTDHAEASARELPRSYASLGIPNLELASSLARIARYHDPLTTHDKVDHATREAKIARTKNALRHVRIEPFGTARELYVATLLALGDHMDASHNRSMPRYVTPDTEIGFKGAFRRLVSGTGYDPATYTLKTTISGFDEATPANRGAFAFDLLYTHFVCRKLDGSDRPSEIAAPNRGPGQQNPFFTYVVSTCCPKLESKHPSRMFAKCLSAGNNEGRYILERLVLTDQTEAETTVPSLWPADYLVAVVLNDLGVNRRFFRDRIKAELDEMSLRIDDWLIEFSAEVFDESGKLTTEPVFRGDLLDRVAREMWDLRCRVLDREVVSYERLADSLRMENAALVGLVVRRIAHWFNEASNKVMIIAGMSGWRFSGESFERKALLEKLGSMKEERTGDVRSQPT